MELLKELMTARHTIAVALKDVSNGRFEVKQILVRKTGSSNPRKCYDFDVVLKQIVAEQAEHIVISEVKEPRCPQEVTHKETRRLASKRQFSQIEQTYETNSQQAELKDANFTSIVDTIATGLLHEINEGIQKLSGTFDAMESVRSAGNGECQGTKGENKTDMVTIATIHFDKLKSEEAVKPKVNAATYDKTRTTVTSRAEEIEDLHDMNTDVFASCNKDKHSMNTDILSECNNLDDINMANPQNPQEDHVANEDYSDSDNDDSARDPDWQPPTENTAKKQAISNIDVKSSCKATSVKLFDGEKGETGGKLDARTTHDNQEPEISKIPILSSFTSKIVCGVKYSSVQFYEFECFFCPGKRVFNRWSLLGKHILKAHCKRGSDGRFRIDCLYECGKTFYLTFPKSSKCPVDSLSNLRTRLGEVLKHVNFKHKREFPKCVKVFTCPVFVCGYSHVIASIVKRHHKVTHLSRDRFTCEKCGTTLCSKNSLKKHIIKECSSKLPVEKKQAPSSCTTMAVAGEQIGNINRMLSDQTVPNSKKPYTDVSQTTSTIESYLRGPCNAENVFDRNSLDLSEATDLSQTSDMESVENCENPSVGRDVKECSQVFDTKTDRTESEGTLKECTSGHDVKEACDVSKVINDSKKPFFGSDNYRQARDQFYSITIKKHKCLLCPDEPSFSGEKALGKHMFRKHCYATGKIVVIQPNVNAARDDETGTTSISRAEEIEDMHPMNTDDLASCNKDMHSMNTDILSDCNNLDGKNSISSADDINMTNPQSPQEDHVANEDYSDSDNDDSDRDPDWQPPTENTAKKQAISNIDAKSSCKAKSGKLCDVEKGETGGNLVALTTHQNQEAEKSKIPLLSSLTSKRVCGLKYSSVQFYEFECFFCPGKRVYNSWSLLGKHILKAHCKRGDDCRFRIDCLYECGKTFYLTFSNSKGCPVDSLSNLQTRLGEVLNHFNCKHKREFPKCVKVFTCPVFVCGYSHVIATNVQRHHKETHLSRDRFTCEKCGKNWCSKNSLKRHIIKECSSKLPVEKKKAPTSCTTMAVAGEQIGNVIRMLSGQTFPNSREPFSVSQTTGHIESCQRGPCNAEHVFDRNSLDLSEATDLSQTSDMESVENCENPSDVKECSQEFESEETQKEGTSGQDIKETYDVSKVINNSPKPSFGSDAYRQTRDKFYSITFKEHKCFLCVDEPLFRGEKGLGMHMLRKHCSAGPYGVWEIQCPQKACNKLFHFRKKKEQPYSRTDVLIRKLPSVYMHLYRKHDFGSLHYVKMPKCHAEGCDFRHVLPSVMQRHFKNVHGEKVLVPCDKCGVQIQEKYLSKHKKMHCKAIEAYNDPSNRLPCPQCDKTFKTTDGLDTHIKIIHENRHRVYMCEICSYTARHPNALEQHMFKAHDHNPKGLPIFQCEHCDYRVVWERAYRKHVETIHNKKNKACEECGLTFTGHNAMKRHNETHSSEVYQCDQCTYSTKHKIYFQRHTRAQHKKSRAFPCKYCPYKSGYSENTLKHMKSCGRKHGVPGT